MSVGQAVALNRRWRITPGLLVQICVALVIVAWTLKFARYMIQTTFMPYDDEGYMLLSFRGYLAGHHLYSDVATEYGPFHYIWHGLLFRLLHVSITHDGGRLITLLDWMLAAVLGGGFVYRMSKNLLVASAAFFCSVVIGYPLAKEPGHPQQILLPLLILAAFVAPARESSFIRARFLCLGAIGSALLLTKINVGVFYFAALAHTCLGLLPSDRIRKAIMGLVVFGGMLLPLVLMYARLSKVEHYCLLATLCLMAVFGLGAWVRTAISLPPQPLLMGTAGAALAAAIIAGITFLHGVSPYWLLTGVVLEPTKHPLGTLWPFFPSRYSVLLLVASALTVWLFMRGPLKSYPHLGRAASCAAGALAILFLFSMHQRRLLGLPYPAPRLDLAVSLLPFGLLPGTARDWRDLFPRLLLTDLAATQFLEAYPVAADSQVNLAASSLVLWAFVCLVDGIPSLLSLLPPIPLVGQKTLLYTAALFISLLVIDNTRHHRFTPFEQLPPPSNLAGMQSVHLQPAQEALFESMTGQLRANCDVLFSMPGMWSFNLWSGVAAPDGSNISNWMPALSAQKQQHVLDILQAHPRACAVTHPEMIDHYSPPGFLTSAPLAVYILRNMPVVFTRDGYEIRADSRIVAWNY